MPVFRGSKTQHWSTSVKNLTPEGRKTLGLEGPEHDDDSFGWTEPGPVIETKPSHAFSPTQDKSFE